MKPRPLTIDHLPESRWKVFEPWPGRRRLRRQATDQYSSGEGQRRRDRRHGDEPAGSKSGPHEGEGYQDEDHHDYRVYDRFGASAGDEASSREAVAVGHNLDR